MKTRSKGSTGMFLVAAVGCVSSRAETGSPRGGRAIDTDGLYMGSYVRVACACVRCLALAATRIHATRSHEAYGRVHGRSRGESVAAAAAGCAVSCEMLRQRT